MKIQVSCGIFHGIPLERDTDRARLAEIVGLPNIFEKLSPIFPEVTEGYRRCSICRISRISEDGLLWQ